MPSKNKLVKQKVVRLPKLVDCKFKVTVSFLVDPKEYNNPRIENPRDAANLAKAMMQRLADFPDSYAIVAEEAK